MHIPDGFLDTKTIITFDVLSGATIGVATKVATRKLDEKTIPLTGVLGAFVFAAQMLNFPVAGGTSGHFVGGALMGILLGPYIGTLVMTVVLVLQCLLFQDGGLTALGANIFNMGILATLVGYYTYTLSYKKLGRNISAFLAGFLSTVLASASCSFQLALSGTVPLRIVLPAMVSVHTLIGVGEGLITLFAINFLARVRPDLLEISEEHG